MSLKDIFDKLPFVQPQMSLLGEGAIPFSGGLYPWSWARSEQKSFRSLQGGLLVAPILRELILNREPERVLEWARRVSQWPIRRIIPCHLENNIITNGKAFLDAFSFLEASPSTTCPQPEKEDLSLLRTASELLTKFGIVEQRQPPIEKPKRNIISFWK